MYLSIKDFADSLCHPCYLQRNICIRKIPSDSFILIISEEARIFLFVRECFGDKEQAIPFLKVDILGYRNCTLPSQSKDIFMCGADADPKIEQGKVIFTPFVQNGYSIFLSEMHLRDPEVIGYYFVISKFYMLKESMIQ